jgi:hypothetical protein
MKKILVVEVFLTTKGKKKTQKNVVGRWNHKRNKEKQKAQKKCCWEVEPQKKQRKTKGKEKCWEAEPQKEQRKTKGKEKCWEAEPQKNKAKWMVLGF